MPTSPEPVCLCVLAAQSCLTLCDTWAVARQAPLCMEFSRQENWSGLPCPPSGDLPYPGIKPGSPALQAYSLPSGNIFILLERLPVTFLVVEVCWR